MKLKKFFKSDSNKTYLKNERTYQVKKKMKKLKNILGEEAKNTIDRTRRESVYIPLENNTTIESPVSEKTRSLSSKKFKNFSTKKKSSKAPEVASEESDTCSVEKEISSNSGAYEDSECEEECAQPIQVKKKKKHGISEIKLNTSVSEPLISEPEGSRDLRTIYVGNLPVDFKKKKLLKVLKQYGNVEKMWTRGVKPLSALPKKIALIKGKLPENHPPLMVHAVFKTIVEAHNALKLNGELYDGNRLRVTMSQEKVFDSRKGVFVGNLPFEVEDDDLFNLFQQCGEIINVRVVRDGKTGAGKGFGYVNFKSIDAVELALNLDGEKLNGREVRVQRLFSPGKKKKADKKKEKQSQSKGLFSSKKSKSVATTEKRSKKKSKLNVSDLKKKIMAKKLSIRTKKSTH